MPGTSATQIDPAMARPEPGTDSGSGRDRRRHAPPLPAPTREALLAAAEALFSERSYGAVGIRDLAERARANIAAIRYHFGSKRELYLEMMRQVMNRGDAATGWSALAQGVTDSRSAAAALVRFVRWFLPRQVGECENRCASLMLREALEPSDAIDTVVQDYIEPRRAQLHTVVRRIAPELDDRAAARAVQSILGQVLHYRVFLPFIERMMPAKPGEPGECRAIADHIARFSLAGLGCDAAQIKAALRAAEAPTSEGMAP